MDFFLKITGIQSCCTIPDLCNLVVQKQNTQFVEGQRWPGLGKEGEQGFAPGTWWWRCLLRWAAPLAPDIYHYLAWHKYINRQITCAVNSRELPAVRIVLITLKINSVLLWAWVFVGFFFAKPLHTLQESEEELEKNLNAAINRKWACSSWTSYGHSLTKPLALGSGWIILTTQIFCHSQEPLYFALVVN